MSIETIPPQIPEDAPNPLQPKRRRWPLVLLLLFVSGIAAAGGAYAWANIGTIVQSFAREGAESTDSSDKSAMSDLLAAQQKTSEDIETLNKTVIDQQEQLHSLMHQ